MLKTWKVIIADDEAIIREGIRASIPWQNIQLEVVAEAEDGEEALELALEYEVDIILVDLSMPIMNGLTLIRQLREKLPNCLVSIITGHDEFSYAQQAIKLNVHDYILKPINPELLSEMLRKMVIKLEKNEVQSSLMIQASKQIDKNIDALRERFCQEWVKGEIEQDEIIVQLKFLRLAVIAPKAIAIVRWQDQVNFRSMHGERDRQLILYAIENIAKECIAEHCQHIFRDEKQDIIIMLAGSLPQWKELQIIESIKRYLNIDIRWCEYANLNGYTGVSHSYMEAKQQLNREIMLTPLIKQAKDQIDERYWDGSLSLEKIACHLNVTPVYLSRAFKQELGYSFIHYVTFIRMKRAIHLLQDQRLSILEIAEKTGYDTQHYFSTAFKKLIGMSPNQYRKADRT
ncbi:response regulator transcription factor [Paenibacillus endoradicis]|uniref:response regulator transcription factor n=1 Tax=Paenibacillus endoradicis TaxID=2972487 RepID=UPI002158E3EF|nr:response regulator [Paenibacillus endoradicis]MCR8657989.1 response regulator [Paenibacillus endoradicis]